jgi:hypothetical protein
MHRQMTAYRKLKGLPPLRSVVLTGNTYDNDDNYFDSLQHGRREILLHTIATDECSYVSIHRNVKMHNLKAYIYTEVHDNDINKIQV